MSNKVLIIGIDGATFRIIKPLAEQGKLPAFSRLMKNGAHGVLRSTIPPITAPAWTSFTTGKNPGKHGLFHFTTFKKGSYDYSLVNATLIKSKTMFRLASEAGKRVISINVPVTYPPEELNGIMISGMLSPKEGSFTHPASLSQKLRDDGYIIDMLDRHYETPEERLEFAKKMAEKRLEISQTLLGENHWDLAMVVFVGADRLQHNMWEQTDLLNDFYIHQDKLLGKLLEVTDDSTYVMMMSDHGFTPTKAAFFVNQWLADEGYLKKYLWRVAPALAIYELVGKSQRTFMFRLKNIIKSIVAHMTRGRVLDYPQISINYSKSRAFAKPSEMIFINLRGREAAGKVGPGEEYEDLKREIAEKLKDLTDPETGEKLLEDAVIKDDLYSGEYFDEAPDIGLVPKEDGYALVGMKSHHSYVQHNFPTNSFHSMNGIFFLSGPDTIKNSVSGPVQMVDCMPTILHILGVPVPEDVDGQVLKGLFAEGSPLRTSEPQRQGSSQITDRDFKKASDEDERLMEEQLKGLGYLS